MNGNNWFMDMRPSVNPQQPLLSVIAALGG